MALEALLLLAMHIRKFFKLHHDIVRFRFFPRIAKRSIAGKYNLTCEKFRDQVL